MDKTVVVNVRGVVNAKLEMLHPFQEEIKILTEENYQRMKAAITEDGFSFSPHVFIDSDGKLWLLDGHQRRTCLERMQNEEGWKIPTIPCMEVEAKDLEHARRLVLEAASQFGTFQVKKVTFFVEKTGLDLAGMDKRVALPNAIASQMRTVTFTAGSKGDQGELDKKKEIECPACHHKFHR